MSSYEDLMKTLLKEAIEKEKLEERRAKEKTVQALNVSAAAGSKLETKDINSEFSFLDAKHLITTMRDRLTEKGSTENILTIQGIASAPQQLDFKSSISLANSLGSYFLAKDMTKQPSQCLDDINDKILITAALSNLLKRFDPSSAGFENEKFVASLLPGFAQVPTSTGEGVFNDIADLRQGDIGISLKTKKKGVSGSLKDLFYTMQIPVTYTDKNGNRIQSRGRKSKGGQNYLYYVFFSKPRTDSDREAAYLTIIVYRVTQSALLNYLDLDDSNKLQVTDSVGNYLAYDLDQVTEAKKKGVFVASERVVNSKTRLKGIGKPSSKIINIKKENDVIADNQEFLLKEYLQTISLLDKFMKLIEDYAIQYAMIPESEQGLKDIQDLSRVMSTIAPKAIQTVVCKS